MTIAMVEELSLTIGITFLIGFMAYIVWDLAKKSNAGRFGTFILFTALGLGAAGFIIKAVLVETMTV